jgi:hypothetical protein
VWVSRFFSIDMSSDEAKRTAFQNSMDIFRSEGSSHGIPRTTQLTGVKSIHNSAVAVHDTLLAFLGFPGL